MLPEQLRVAITALAVVSFLAAQVALLRRIARAPDVRDAAGTHGRLGRGVELALALVPAVLTAILLALAWRAAASVP